MLLFLGDFMEEGFMVNSDMLMELVTDMFTFSIYAFVLGLIIQKIIDYLNIRLPWEEALNKRFFTEIAIMLLMVGSLTVLFGYSASLFLTIEENQEGEYFFAFVLMTMLFIAIFMLFAFHEFMYLSSDKANLKLTNALLQKQNYMSKYEALKNQVNPHFLFNSLNVLSSLIYVDPVKADTFIKKFSDVFRYVLELNQEKMVTVKKELAFLDAYLYLQKIRFGDNLLIHKCLDSIALESSIPPLTFQLVIENAIKHNVITDQNKLNIWIKNDNDQIIIKNNYSYRASNGNSTGIGQKNLVEKYSLIDKGRPRFTVEDNYYKVCLPLIKEMQWTV